MTAFLIDADGSLRLKIASERARAHPLPWDKLRAAKLFGDDVSDISLADREGPPIERVIEQVVLPFGWRVAISCEEQPAGIMLHISLSSPQKGRVPIPQAMAMVVQACGFSVDDIARIWLEEFEPGWKAVNALVMIAERQGGAA